MGVVNYTAHTFTVSELVTATTLNTDIRDFSTNLQSAWTAYTPALTAVTTNPTIGTGSAVTGAYQRYGKTIFGNFDVLFGTSGFVAGSGIYEVSLPVAAVAASGTTGVVCGAGFFFDSSASSFITAILRIAGGATTCRMMITGGVGLSSTTPVVPANSDRIQGQFTYQAA